MFGFSSIDAALSGMEAKPRKPKALAPLATMDGIPLPEMPDNPLPGEIPAAVIDGAAIFSPYRGKKCAMRGCREGVQWSVTMGDPRAADFEPRLQPELTSDDPLVARIEAARQRMFPAEPVPEGQVHYFCMGHYTELMRARNERIEEAQRNAPKTSWPLHELNWNGATIVLDGHEHFILTDGDGKTMRLEIVMHLKECQARLAGREYRQEVLNAEQVKAFKARVRTAEFAAKIVPQAIHDGALAAGTRLSAAEASL